MDVIHFFSRSFIGMSQAKPLSNAKAAHVTPSPSSQANHSPASDHSRSIATSSASSTSNTSPISAHVLSDVSNSYYANDHWANPDEKEEHDGDTNQDKTDEHHYQETYPISVGPVTWGKTKLGGDMLFMEESIYVFQSKSIKVNKTLWRCQRRDKKCRAVVYTDSTSSSYLGNNGIDHNHPTDLLLAKKHRLISDLKRKAEDLTVNVPAAVDQGIASLGLSHENMVTFPLPKTVGKYFFWSSQGDIPNLDFDQALTYDLFQFLFYSSSRLSTSCQYVSTSAK